MAKLKVYAIFDAAAKAYGPPMVFHTNGLALREFEDICKNTQSQLHKSPADFSCWEIGEYDTDTAILEAGVAPKALAQATEFSNKPALQAVN